MNELPYSTQYFEANTQFVGSSVEGLVQKLLSSDEFHAALARVASLGINYGVERGLRMRRTDVEFEAAIQKVSNFDASAKAYFEKALVDFPTMPFPFVSKIDAASKSTFFMCPRYCWINSFIRLPQFLLLPPVLMKLQNKCLIDHASEGLAANI
ncbi:hypothetical protein Tco_0083387 [Tanacetum coccineum]